MSSKQPKYLPFLAATIVLWLVLYIIYPHYQYYIDPDGTAYLTISKRYAAGDLSRAINGYWSPWSCWFTALVIKMGIEPIPASVIINTLGATSFLLISQSFFLKFNLQRNMQWWLNGTLVVFLSCAVFWQSFDDLWECFFLLGALRILLSNNFMTRPGLWILYGLTGTLAFFAKSYCFPFFILNSICCIYFLSRDNKAQWLMASTVSIAVMTAGSIPWIMALHSKYGIWTTSTAGSLNLSWYLVGHPYWKESLPLSPVYPDSPYYWEDPYIANGPTPHAWDSVQLMGMQAVRICYNLVKLIISLLEISILAPIAALLAATIAFTRKRLKANYSPGTVVLALSLLLFPLGYLPINFEARYIWYIVPLAMVLGTIYVSNMNKVSPQARQRLGILFALSFAVFPIKGLIDLFDAGKKEYNIAMRLKAANIKGTITGNEHPRVMSKIAYFSGNPYYYAPYFLSPDDSLVQSAQAKGVTYYLRFYNRFEGDSYGHEHTFNLAGNDGQSAPLLLTDTAASMKIFQIGAGKP